MKLHNAFTNRFLAASETARSRFTSKQSLGVTQNVERVSHATRQAGFSLVELMVGMVVGLLAIFAILQAFGAFEGQKRTTTSGADAQENGLIALETIASDARWAGYGLTTPPGIKNAPGLACIQMNWFESAQSGVANVAPVAVVDGGVGLADTLTFTGATSPTARAPLPINADVLPGGDPNIANLVGFKQDVDLYLLAEPTTSPGTAAATLPCVRRAFTSGTGSPNAKYNTADAAIYPPGGYPKNVGFVVNIGSDQNNAVGLRQMEYSVSAVAAASGVASSDLIARNVSHQGVVAAPTATLASNIVSLQVQYGVAPPNTTHGASSPSVNCWTDATATRGCTYTGTTGTWANPDARNVMRIKAIRLAVVARSSLKEKPATPGGACSTTPNTLTAWSGGPTIDLTADADWQCYRYRIYETVIPLRNVIWANL